MQDGQRSYLFFLWKNIIKNEASRQVHLTLKFSYFQRHQKKKKYDVP